MRQKFLKLRERYRRRGKTLLYVDETGFEESVVREYAYGLIGQRVYGLRKGGNRSRTSFLGGLLNGKIVAPWTFKGTCNSELFNKWIEHELAPIINDDIVVIMDNAAFHKSLKTKELIENTGATLMFLPPYSPDYNPIEKTFGNMKNKRQNSPNIKINDLIIQSM